MQRVKLCLLTVLCLLGLLAGCGSNEITQEGVSFEQLTPEQQERIRHMHEEANRAAATGQPIPADMITEEMLLGGMLEDGVLVTPPPQPQQR